MKTASITKADFDRAISKPWSGPSVEPKADRWVAKLWKLQYGEPNDPSSPSPSPQSKFDWRTRFSELLRCFRWDEKEEAHKAKITNETLQDFVKFVSAYGPNPDTTDAATRANR